MKFEMALSAHNGVMPEGATHYHGLLFYRVVPGERVKYFRTVTQKWVLSGVRGIERKVMPITVDDILSAIE